MVRRRRLETARPRRLRRFWRGMADVFARPIGGRRVANAIERERRDTKRSDTTPCSALENGDELYAHSMAMREVMALISRAAEVRAGVLVRGEDGSGRQVAARAIHALQRAGDGAFVAVDCGAFDGDGAGRAAFRSRRRVDTTATASSGHRAGQPAEPPASWRAAARSICRTSRRRRRVYRRGSLRLLRDREAIVAETGGAIPFDVRPDGRRRSGASTLRRRGRARAVRTSCAACRSSVSRCLRCAKPARGHSSARQLLSS